MPNPEHVEAVVLNPDGSCQILLLPTDPGLSHQAAKLMTDAIGDDLEAMTGHTVVMWCGEHYLFRDQAYNEAANQVAALLQQPGWGGGLCGPVIVTGRSGPDVGPLPDVARRVLQVIGVPLT